MTFPVLQLDAPNGVPTFLVVCDNLYEDPNFYACLDKDQPFVNLEYILQSKLYLVVVENIFLA